MIMVKKVNNSIKSGRLWLITFLALLIGGVFFSTFCLAQRSGQANESGAAQKPQQKEEAIKAVLFYNVEDPKQLFSILQNIYRVQFEGTDTVVGPLTLISEDFVDVQGMLELLDDELQKQDKKTSRRNHQTIQIEPRSKTEHKFIPLENVDSAEIGKVVNVLKSRFMPATTDATAGDIVKATDIIAHPTQNGILVTGPVEVFDLIEEYLEKTSITTISARTGAQPPSTEKPPMMREYIPLEFMDPGEFQALLERDETLTGKFNSAVERNTLIVYSEEKEIFDKVREIKAIFDVDRLEIRYRYLAYADPKDVADLLGKIYPKKGEVKPEEITLPPELEKLRQAGYEQPVTMDLSPDLPGPFDIEPRVGEMLSEAMSVVTSDEFTIIPDEKRRALIIYTYSRNFPKIEELIEELDQPRPQVFIEVYITEVSYDDSTELGVDFFFTHTDSETTNTIRQSVPATQAPLFKDEPPSVLTYNLISDNFTAFLRALQQTGKVDVISRPSITTEDNTKALFELGDLVPMPKDLAYTYGVLLGSKITIKYEKITNLLEVTPHIHPDDFVTLEIKQKLDEISARTIQISEDFAPQIFITRRAETRVRIQDGQTICLAGFISDKIVENETKIPLLGDIPILGELFKFSKRQRIKTELIIFITPHILASQIELLRMTNEQRRKSVLDPRERRSEIIELERNLRYPPFRDPIKDPNLPDDKTVIPAPKPDNNNHNKLPTENPPPRLQSVPPIKTNPAADKTQNKIKTGN
ncbi:type II secretion system protein GspD [Planctomycetota bacterium]